VGTEEFVRLEVADGVGTVRLDRPPMNALNTAIQDQLREVAFELSQRDDVAAAVLYGGEKVFAAGADIKEMAKLGHAEMIVHSHKLTDAIELLAKVPKPVVAAITGYALGGGCEVALAADRRIVGASAKLGQPEIKLGVIPGAGGTQRLARLIGPARAKDLVFTGRMIDAQEALSIGLVDEVVDDDKVYETAHAWAKQFVGGPAQALRAAKAAIDTGLDVDLHTGLEIERQLFAELFATEDRTIGMEAFVAKSQPQFKGR
jgi:enoyl-CoA hydratase/carnithine racemase